MGGRRTRAQYRAIDLALFAGMLTLFEWLIMTASTRWFPGEPWTVSVTPVITAIVMARWGPWAGIHAVLGGLLLCIFSGAGAAQMVIYCAGNLLGLCALPLLRHWGDEQLRKDAVLCWVWGLAVALGMQVGRALLALCFGYPLTTALGFITTEVITDLFTLVILWIVRRLDGVLENQDHYLRRIQAEQEKEEGGVR